MEALRVLAIAAAIALLVSLPNGAAENEPNITTGRGTVDGGCTGIRLVNVNAGNLGKVTGISGEHYYRAWADTKELTAAHFDFESDLADGGKEFKMTGTANFDGLTCVSELIDCTNVADVQAWVAETLSALNASPPGHVGPPPIPEVNANCVG